MPELSSLEVQRDASGLSLNEDLQHAAISMDESLLLDESRQSKKDRSVRKYALHLVEGFLNKLVV